ncbi:hypothetical protein Hp1_0036 [Helicobacter phage HPy1R]|nr:hypothetical protein Hp1_0036 [Helicobacter phage HPy1R]
MVFCGAWAVLVKLPFCGVLWSVGGVSEAAFLWCFSNPRHSQTMQAVFFKSTPQPNDASGVFQIHATAKRCKRCFSNPRHSQTMQAVFFNNVFRDLVFFISMFCE